MSAQDNATLRVLVVSGEDGTPVAGANVLLLNEEYQEGDSLDISHAGATDKDGFHEFRNVIPKEYVLRVSFIGHENYTRRISLESGEIKIEQVTLPVNVQQLEELVVEAQGKVITGEAGLRRVSSVDLGRIPMPGSGGDLASYMQTLPGVVSTGDRGGDLYIRGGTPTQNKVLVDNMTLFKPFHISNLFSAFPQEAVQNIDIYAGGFGAEYLGATSAIVDVSLRPGNMKNFSGGGSLSPHLVSLQMEGPLTENRESFLIMGRKSTIQKYSDLIDIEEVPIDFYDIVARYSYQSSNFYCNITGMRTFDEGEINPGRDINLSWSNTALGARCRGFDETYNHPFEVTAGYSGFSNSEASPDGEERSAGIKQFFIRIDNKEELFGLPIDYGFGLNLRSVTAELAGVFTNYESFSNLSLIPHTYFSTIIDSGENFTFQPSFGSQVALGSPPTLEPRLRVTYTPAGSESSEFSLAAGRYSQELNGINDQRDAGTVFTVYRPVELEDGIQTALHGILGYKQIISSSLSTNIEGYVKRHRGIPVAKWTPEAQINIETGYANGLTYGFDVRVEYNNHPLYLYLGYGWSKVEYKAASEDLGAWIEEPIFEYSPAHDQRHKINTIASYRIGKYKASASWEMSSGRPYTQVYGFDLAVNVPSQEPLQEPGTARTLYDRPYGERLPYVHRLDFSLERSFTFASSNTLNVKLGCINTYDRDNIFYYDLNSLERVNQTPLLPYFSLKTTFK
ncbi:TonB-dependent receptor plug domain-containing protein [Balneolaceae bacterium YR4-1]|uniref:TonB-dependent receptor plug domain-containing protein n=1 Tax=Halalkalibaculum roseum TaxID=2709311 RepID=A0A6M1STB7_9BACT|nr:carboxypeptidase regulatory-like domain-containing protein [Halalkalibaculum roseum]NGP76140.1 TonB-dependent receptor plug domain-containing protein [Halalkalibaculum roseum]